MTYRTRSTTAVLSIGQTFSATSSVWHTEELHHIIIGLLSLRDLAKFRGVSKEQRDYVDLKFWKRVVRYTSPFFRTGDDHQKFFNTVDTLQSLIIGSVPLAVLSMPSSPAIPNNLNVISTHTTYRRWICTMTYVLKFTLEANEPCVGPYEISGYRFLRFRDSAISVRRLAVSVAGTNGFQDKTVTITFSNVPSVYELWFSAPHTHQWNTITARTLICPHVRATSEGKSVTGWWTRDKDHAVPTEPIQGMCHASDHS
jgi:hypothetical protein